MYLLNSKKGHEELNWLHYTRLEKSLAFLIFYKRWRSRNLVIGVSLNVFPLRMDVCFKNLILELSFKVFSANADEYSKS